MLCLNMVEPFLLTNKILTLSPAALKNTSLGIITFSGLVLAGITQLIVGYISDQVSSLRERITKIMFLGAFALSISFSLITISETFLQLLLFYVCIQISISTVQNPGQTFLTRLVPQNRIGIASSVKSILEILATVIAAIFLSQLINKDLSFLAVIGISLLLLFSLVAKYILVSNPHEEFSNYYPAKIITSFNEYRGELSGKLLRLWMINRVFFWMPMIAIRGLLIFYLNDAKGISDPLNSSANLITIIAISTVFVAIPSGILADKLGSIPLLGVAGLASMSGSLMLLLGYSKTQLLISGILLGCGLGIFVSSSWSLLTNIIPQASEGKAFGISNVATVIASATGRLWGPAIDLGNHLLGQNNGYHIALLFSITCFAAGILILIPLRRFYHSTKKY